MSLISDFIAAMAFSQLLLLSMYFGVKFEGKLAKLLSFYGFCLAAYTLTTVSFVAASPVTVYVLFRLATLAPLLLWLISFFMFVDNGKVTPVIWSAMAYAEIARTIGIGLTFFYPDVLDSNVAYFLIIFLPQAILLYFSVDTFYLAWAGFRVDLVEQRRNVRILFVLVMGVLVITVVGGGFVGILGRFVSVEGFANWLPVPTAMVALYIFFTAFFFNLSIFRVKDDAIVVLASPEKTSSLLPSADAKPKASHKYVDQLTTLMQEKRLYAQTGLTISDLAAALNLQEYRVRRLINQQLGYRNFNQFLNNYRVEEARMLLLNTESSISNIALDVGYASLSVFNKAFKERYMVTPREYRLQHKLEDHHEKSPA